MPWHNGNKDFRSYYQIPVTAGLIHKYHDDLDEKRKQYAALLQEFKAYQKEFSKQKDLKTARFFKSAARHTQKQYYGICAALDYAGSDTGDCVDSLKNMTKEIAPFADFWIVYAVDCKEGFKSTPEQQVYLDYKDMLKRFENAEQIKFVFMNIVPISEQIDFKFEDEEYF